MNGSYIRDQRVWASMGWACNISASSSDLRTSTSIAKLCEDAEKLCFRAAFNRALLETGLADERIKVRGPLKPDYLFRPAVYVVYVPVRAP